VFQVYSIIMFNSELKETRGIGLFNKNKAL